jgi:hypothetical protein
MKTKRYLPWGALGLLAAFSVAQAGQGPTRKDRTPDALKAEITSLQAAKVAWREIAWKSCLLDGLRESREKGKPVVLWIFIDRPADDARC